MKVSKEEVLKILEKVKDPELNLSVVDLGLIYEINIGEKKIRIKMTLTSPFCPMASLIVEDVRRNVEEKLKIPTEVEITFDPPWSPERLSKKAREKLGFC